MSERIERVGLRSRDYCRGARSDAERIQKADT
jgi:hypothetical protein